MDTTATGQEQIFRQLLDERIVFLGTEVTDASANEVCAKLLLLNSVAPEKDIYLYINSPGGSVTSEFAIYDTMEGAVTDAANLLARVAARVDTIGRPLAAANSALPVEPDPYRRLWQAATTLREHRGDGHVIALVERDRRPQHHRPAQRRRHRRDGDEEGAWLDGGAVGGRGRRARRPRDAEEPAGDQREGHGGSRSRRTADQSAGARSVARADR